MVNKHLSICVLNTMHVVIIKAFDTIDHEILYRKLDTIGALSIDWFKSYLTNRKQFVHINNVFFKINKKMADASRRARNML